MAFGPKRPNGCHSVRVGVRLRLTLARYRIPEIGEYASRARPLRGMIIATIARQP